MRSENYITANSQSVALLEKALIRNEITELERKVIRYRRAQLSCFSRPIDQENLINAQADLRVLGLLLAAI